MRRARQAINSTAGWLNHLVDAAVQCRTGSFDLALYRTNYFAAVVCAVSALFHDGDPFKKTRTNAAVK